MAEVSPELIAKIQSRVAEQSDDIIQFLRDIVAIPSMDSQIRECGERCEAEMKKLGFNEVFWDKMGNCVGRIGDGETILLYDSHIDTVGVGDPDEWEWDPFKGKIEDGILYARGASDEKNSTSGMIYGLALAKELGLLDGYTAYVFLNMEERNDGGSCNAFVQTEGIKPDVVLIGEPTCMDIYRGQKGRVEFKVVAKGRSAHAASNHLGDNAIYKLVPIIDAISKLESEFHTDPFLGQGRITVSDMRVQTPSLNAVPDEATIFVDRRLTWGEDPYEEVQRVREIVGDRDDITVEILLDDEPSYTGFIFPLDKIYPAWVMDEGSPIVQAGLDTGKALWGEMKSGKWDFSTNGIYWAGKLGIPSIGFGPGDPEDAHTVLDRVPLEDVVRSTEFYALFPVFARSINS